MIVTCSRDRRQGEGECQKNTHLGENEGKKLNGNFYVLSYDILTIQMPTGHRSFLAHL
jgi:hypothetical protein